MPRALIKCPLCDTRPPSPAPLLLCLQVLHLGSGKSVAGLLSDGPKSSLKSKAKDKNANKVRYISIGVARGSLAVHVGG